jgi:hypothetical protein
MNVDPNKIARAINAIGVIILYIGILFSANGFVVGVVAFIICSVSSLWISKQKNKGYSKLFIFLTLTMISWFGGLLLSEL